MTNTANYSEQGGERTVITGTLAFPSGGTVEFGGFNLAAGTDTLTKTYRQPLAGVTVQAIQNTTGVDQVVQRFALQWDGTLAAVTLDIGVNASPTTSADNLLDGVALVGTGTTRYMLSNTESLGTNGRGTAVWPAGHYLTLTNNGTNRAGLADVIAHISVTSLEA